MRTTVRLPGEVLEAAKRQALDRGTTLTELFEEALREHLARHRPHAKTRKRVELPTFRGRGPRPGIDLHDSASLLERMEEAGDDRP